MKKRGVLLIIIFLFTAVLYAAPLRDGSARNEELILLHTNDFHGALLESNGQGGLANMAAFVKTVKAVYPDVLLVDAGDFNTGSAISNMFDAEPGIRGYNMMGYDAVTFGNHEFDGTLAKLEKQINLASFPFVSSNIKKKDGSYLGGNRYIVKRYGNFSVGIFGITTLRTQIIANPDESLVFTGEIETARTVVDILRNIEKVNIVIGLTHLGDVQETEDHITSVKLAETIEGIDIIVDGHSHSLFKEPVKAGNTFIVSANEWGKYVGCARITVRNGRLAGFNWALAPIGPDAEVAAMLAPFIEKANSTLNDIIGTASDTFEFGNRLTRYRETALGNMICDANVWYLRNVSNMQVDFAFHNGGNIRAELPKGPITHEKILTILPFDNYLYVVSMTGYQIIDLFNYIATIPQGNGGFPQVSGDVRFTIDKTSGNGVIKDLTIRGARVDPNKTYRLCTNDYILNGGDGYDVMRNPKDPFNTSILLSYVVTEYIKARGGVITPVTDGRMTILGGVQ